MGWRTVAISFDVTIQRVGGRLFDYDRRILVNGLRARFAAWQDRLIAAIGLLIMLGGLREWFTDRPWTLAAPVGLIAAGICGLSSGRAISSRLVFHAFDGPLAADAIRLPTCKRYMIAWHAMGLAILATITLIARPSLLIAVLPGYVTGAIIGGRTFGFGLSGLFAKWRGNGWRTQSWTRHPHAGIVCAAFLCLTLPLANFVGIGAIVIVVVIEATMLALALTAVDDGIVRFLTLAGHSSWRIITRQARGAALFAGAAAPFCALVLGPVAGAVVTGVSIAALLLMTMRILAYRLHAKRSADLLVSIRVTILVFASVSMPMISPVIAIAVFWPLQRRAAARTWMIA